MKHKRIFIFALILFVAGLMGYTISQHTMKTNLQTEKSNIVKNYVATISVYNEIFNEAKGVIASSDEEFEKFSKLNEKVNTVNLDNFDSVYDLQIELFSEFFTFVQANKNIIFNEKSSKEYLFDDFRKRKDYFFIVSNSYQEMLKDA
jgi:ADP-heptose:LPS heptosyltransferase